MGSVESTHAARSSRSHKFWARLLRVHVLETLREQEACYTIREAKLGSYGRNRVGAFVLVHKSDFGCCGPLFGVELALQKSQLDPTGEPVSFFWPLPAELLWLHRSHSRSGSGKGLVGGCFPSTDLLPDKDNDPCRYAVDQISRCRRSRYHASSGNFGFAHTVEHGCTPLHPQE